MGFVGGRYTKDEKIPGAGKGGGDDPTQIVYYERGMHMISFGEARSLIKIIQNGKIIWEGNLTIDNTPSGSTIDIGTEGAFQIYWGEDPQPLCTGLAGYTGVNSTYPSVFYIYWDVKRMGTSPVWPTLEYEVTAAPVPLASGGVVGDSFVQKYSFTDLGRGYYIKATLIKLTTPATWKVDNPYTVRVQGADAVPDIGVGNRIVVGNDHTGEVTGFSRDATYTYIDCNFVLPPSLILYPDVFPPIVAWKEGKGVVDVYGWPFWGASPAFTLEQFIFHPRPLGAGYPRERFDDSLQDFYDLAVTEETPCTSLLKSGRSWRDGIASILQDYGVIIYFDQTSGKYGFKSIREGDIPVEIALDEINAEEVVESFGYAVLAADNRTFTFKDSARKFSDSTIKVIDEAVAKYSEDPNSKKVSLETITNFPSASRAASRRDKELSVNGTLSTTVAYSLAFRIGALVIVEGISKVYRVASLKSDPDEAKKTLGLIQDSYSSENNYIVQGPVGTNPGNRRDVAPDVAVILMETNRFRTPNINGFHPLRIRYDTLPSSAFIYSSADDITYGLSGTSSSVTGGSLVSDLLEGTATFIETGPEITLLGEDVDKIQDLRPNEELWRSGTQLCFIGGELFFLRNVVVVSLAVVRLEGLIRARYGTSQLEHLTHDEVFIFDPTQIELINDPWMAVGRDVFVKSLATSATSSVAIEDMYSVSLTPYQGGGYRPLQPANLTTEDLTAYWVSGEDVVLNWDYKNASSQAGAGIPLSDEPQELALPEGYFKLEILDGLTVVRTEFTLALSTFTYTQAMMSTDFGSEPADFDVRVYEVLNGLTSPVEENTITRV
jgi:hypothetical protein